MTCCPRCGEQMLPRIEYGLFDGSEHPTDTHFMCFRCMYTAASDWILQPDYSAEELSRRAVMCAIFGHCSGDIWCWRCGELTGPSRPSPEVKKRADRLMARKRDRAC